MNNLNTITNLREYISNLAEEIKLIDARRIQLSHNGYYDLILQRKSLCNLIALAKNELYSQLIQYNFVVLGNISNKKGEVREKVFKGKVYSEFNFPVKNSRGTSHTEDYLKPLLALISKECAHKFIEGKYHVRSLRRIKKNTNALTENYSHNA